MSTIKPVKKPPPSPGALPNTQPTPSVAAVSATTTEPETNSEPSAENVEPVDNDDGRTRKGVGEPPHIRKALSIRAVTQRLTTLVKGGDTPQRKHTGMMGWGEAEGVGEARAAALEAIRLLEKVDEILTAIPAGFDVRTGNPNRPRALTAGDKVRIREKFVANFTGALSPEALNELTVESAHGTAVHVRHGSTVLPIPKAWVQPIQTAE